MNTASTTSYLDSLLQGQPPASSLTWLNQLRANAVDRVGALTVPTTRDEDWRFTDISPLTKLSFQPARGVPQLAPATVEQWAIPEAAARLVFVDGTYAPQHSFNHAGITVENLAAGVIRHDAAVQAHLGRHAGFERNAFTALNTAFLHDGALIIVPRDMALAAPVHLLLIATRKHTASYPRCLVIAESGSAVTLVEDFVALQNEAYFTNAVTEMALAGNAQVNHVRVQRDGAARAVFNGNIMVRAGAQRTDSSQSSRNLLLSGKARVDTKPQLEIFADDVKCAHGATVGQLDVDEVFYLKSRGLSDTAARNLLTYAFGAEVIERIPVASLRNRLEQAVLAQTQTAAPGAAGQS